MSPLGVLPIREAQARRLGLAAYQQLSPLLEKCALRLGANQSYQQAEVELEAQMGIRVSHSTLQRLVQRSEIEMPTAKQKVTQLSMDGGKVRVRHRQQGQASEWLEYKSVRLEALYYGAAFQDNSLLSDWVNAQALCHPLVCLGDGHDGVWNLARTISRPQGRLEILDWYHLKENLYKIGGSLQRLHRAQTYLWHGQVAEAIGLFDDCKLDQARKFRQYVNHHRARIVNYSYCQAEGIPIGSGAVESSIKQIDHRMKLPGAQWNRENIPQALSVRCAYLNGLLDL
jgi:hypothetical protein